jgi:hypothetical protein
MKMRMMKTALSLAVLVAGASTILAIVEVSNGAAALEASPTGGAETSAAAPLYRSSVVGTDFDFIRAGDHSAFQRLEFTAFEKFEMPDKRGTGEPLIQEAYLFDAHFTDGTKVRIALNKDFGSRQAAEQDARRYTAPLGKLPSLYRKSLKHVVVHTGGADTTAFAEDKGHFFVIYSDNATKRIGTHDLEETFFHEGTHATIQAKYLEEESWKSAKRRDNAHITNYAKSEDQEDFAESALFAYTFIHHPERLPAAEREKIAKRIPNRISFFRTVFGG